MAEKTDALASFTTVTNEGENVQKSNNIDPTSEQKNSSPDENLSSLKPNSISEKRAVPQTLTLISVDGENIMQSNERLMSDGPLLCLPLERQAQPKILQDDWSSVKETMDRQLGRQRPVRICLLRQPRGCDSPSVEAFKHVFDAVDAWRQSHGFEFSPCQDAHILITCGRVSEMNRRSAFLRTRYTLFYQWKSSSVSASAAKDLRDIVRKVKKDYGLPMNVYTFLQ